MRLIRIDSVNTSYNSPIIKENVHEITNFSLFLKDKMFEGVGCLGMEFMFYLCLCLKCTSSIEMHSKCKANLKLETEA